MNVRTRILVASVASFVAIGLAACRSEDSPSGTTGTQPPEKPLHIGGICSEPGASFYMQCGGYQIPDHLQGGTGGW
jgi:hypothetical protein